MSLAQCFGGLETASSALRQNNHHKADWLVEWLFDEMPPESFINNSLHAAAQSLKIPVSADYIFKFEELETKDWLAASYEQFQPFSVGPFFIYGSHSTITTTHDQIPLQIDAATAFGSGQHGTTKGCLEALIDLKASGIEPRNILDMGTGSGILAIAAAKLWAAPIMAVDNDEEAVRIAILHQTINSIGSSMLSVCGDGFAASLVQQRKPFDLIIANILASALKDMGPELRSVCADQCHVILSGILNEQVQSVLDIYQALGFTLQNSYEQQDWTTLLLQKF
jgi:ribosomal protein L11 methyltransferase